MLEFFLHMLMWMGVLLTLGLAGYYIFWRMVKASVIWTSVEKGWCKIVLEWGDYHNRTIGPGLHLIGIPGMHTLLVRKMTFLKSVTDKEGRPQAEPHEDEDISSFKTTDYAYAFPFKDEEDSHGLHLSGMLAVIGVLEDYEKAFFAVSDWYSIMNSEIMPCFRDVLVQISYDDDIVGRDTDKEQAQKTFSDRLWKTMNRRKVVERLRTQYGIWVKSIELRSVDPPPGWREITLAPYKAGREKDAAKQQAEMSAILLDDTNQALEAWKKTNPNASPDQIAEKQSELARRAYLKAGGQYQEVHGLENAGVVGFGGGGGGLGILAGAGGKNPGKKGGQRKKIADMTEEELRKELDED